MQSSARVGLFNKQNKTIAMQDRTLRAPCQQSALKRDQATARCQGANARGSEPFQFDDRLWGFYRGCCAAATPLRRDSFARLSLAGFQLSSDPRCLSLASSILCCSTASALTVSRSMCFQICTLACAALATSWRNCSSVIEHPASSFGARWS
jgi:hypothetical protein